MFSVSCLRNLCLLHHHKDILLCLCHLPHSQQLFSARSRSLALCCAVCIWPKGSPIQISETLFLLRSLYPVNSSQFSNLDIWSLFPELNKTAILCLGYFPAVVWKVYSSKKQTKYEAYFMYLLLSKIKILFCLLLQTSCFMYFVQSDSCLW